MLDTLGKLCHEIADFPMHLCNTKYKSHDDNK